MQMLDQFIRSAARIARVAKKRLPFGKFFRFQLSVRVLKPMELIDGRALEAVSASAPETIFLTNPVFGTEKIAASQSAALAIRQSSSVVFEPHQDLIGQGKHFFMQSFGGRLWKSFNHYHSSGSAIVAWNYKSIMLIERDCVPSPIPAGIIINGSFPGNWYHWMVNILPKLEVLACATSIPTDVPLLMPEVARSRNFAEAVKIANRDQRPIIYLPHKPHLVKDAFIIDSPAPEVKAIRGRKDPDWRCLGDFHFGLMRAWREALLLAAAESPSPVAPRIFLRRTDETVRPFNSQEVEAALVKRGYVAVTPEDLPFLEQISLFRQAEIIVTSTGAQQVGLMWTNEAKCLTIVPPFLSGTSGYSKIAALGRSRIFEFHLETKAKTWIDYYLSSERAIADVEALNATLDTLEQL